MKNFFLSLIVVLAAQFSLAQKVGIGTNAPNAKAALEINSTSKVLLIPTMTTAQIFAVTSLPNWLLIYNSSYGEQYQHNGTARRPILKGDYWSRPITSRKKIANILGKWGHLRQRLFQWLNVDGNIRISNNVLAIKM